MGDLHLDAGCLLVGVVLERRQRLLEQAAVLPAQEYKSSQNLRGEGPGQVVQLVRASSGYPKAVGSIPGTGHVQESTNECVNKWNNKLMLFFLSLPHFSLS